MMKTEIEKILNLDSVKQIKNAYEESNFPFTVKIFFDKNKKQFFAVDLYKSLDVNDLIYFKEGAQLEKAVITAKGINGITGRDKTQKQIKIRYQNILFFKKRKKVD